MAIEFMNEPHPDEATLGCLHPLVREWFTTKFKALSPPQQYSILNIFSGVNTLISSPTGSGKTLSAFLAILNRLIVLQQGGELEQRVYCVYLSPLKALANDITKNLKEPLKEIQELAKQRGVKVNISVGSRTGDTTPSKRQSMLEKPPHILITTPESLAISLTTVKFREMLKTAEFLIIDEIHALAENKRGVHLSLSLERLHELTNEGRALDECRSLVRIGLSATVSPLEEVAKFLVGLEYPSKGIYRPCKIVDVQAVKGLDLKVLCPVPDIMRASHGEQHAAMYDLLHDLIQGHRTTLVFTNTRSATERVVHQLKARYPRHYTGILDGDVEEAVIEAETEKEEGIVVSSNTSESELLIPVPATVTSTKKSRGFIGAHHGSLSKAHRLNIENRLRKGELKAVVCSTSLELGIDIGSIDLVVLLGSPKSVARGLQRIGRSGHQLHEKARGRIIVLDRDDMVECSVLLKAAIEKKIDKVHIPRNALDVLAQQLFCMAIERVRSFEETYAIVRQSHAYATLTKEDFQAVIDYLSGEHVSLEQRSVYAKIWYDRESGMIGKRGKMARLIALTNIGTIPDETSVKVKIGEEVIGTIDEGFLERLTPGDVFVLGGETYEFRFSRGLTAQVKSSAGRPPTVPSWASEMLPLSYDLALEIQRFRKSMDELFVAEKSKKEIVKFMDNYLYADERTLSSIYEYFREQYRYALVPHTRRIVIEHSTEKNVRVAIVHTLYGRRVNDVLARALAYALGRLHERDIAIAITDTGFSLRSTSMMNIRKALDALKAEELGLVMRQALDKSEVLARRFRHCAGRSLMILRMYKGESKSVGKQQMNSRLLLSAVKRISDDFPVLKEARREVLEDLMDVHGATEVLHGIEKGTIKVEEVHAALPSPFAFNIILQSYTDILKVEERRAFLQRMHEMILKEIDAPAEKKRAATREELAAERDAFSYETVWKEAEERRLAERDEELERLKREAWNLPHVPVLAKREIVGLLDGATKIREDVEAQLLLHKSEIERTWTPALVRRIFTALSIPFDDELLAREEEKSALRAAFRKGAQRARVDDADALVRAADALIDTGTVDDKEFWTFIDELLSKPVPKYWSDEIVKFLTEMRKRRSSRKN